MKTIFRANLIILFLLLGLTSVQGQGYRNHFYYNYLNIEKPVEFGIKMGVNTSSLSGMDFDTSQKLNVVAGLFLDFNLSRQFYISTGLDYINKGSKADLQMYYEGWTINFEDTKIKAMYMQIPIHAGYKVWVGRKSKLSFHAGPYIAYGIGGQVELGDRLKKRAIINGEEFTGEESLDDFVNVVKGFQRKWDTFGEDTPNGVKDLDGDKMQTFDRFDYGLGVGISFQHDHVVGSINYDFGLADISKSDKTKVKNKSGYFTIGYKF